MLVNYLRRSAMNAFFSLTRYPCLPLNLELYDYKPLFIFDFGLWYAFNFYEGYISRYIEFVGRELPE